MTGVTGFTGSVGFTVSTGFISVGVGVGVATGVTGVAGVTVQSAFIVAPLGVVDDVTGAGGGVVGVGACVCQACGVALVQTAGIVPALAIF